MMLINISVSGQRSFEQDTIRISEVIISSKKASGDPKGYKSISLDSSILKDFSHKTVAEVLIQSSNVFIKSYGVGGIATPSLRGANASQTQLSWNNIPIYNPMLGQSDLSLIPAGIIDEVNIYYGGSSMPHCAGGIGGLINLETKPVWSKETLISLNPGIGSFGQYSGLVKVRTGNVHFQSVTKGYLQYAENDFRYLNSVSSNEPVWEVRKNNQTKQKGLLQELYYRKKKNTLSARLWYQSADRNLPSSLLIQLPDNNEKQFDESLRTILNYDGYKGLSEYSVTGSLSVLRLDYLNNQAAIDSRNLSKTAIVKAGVINRIGGFVRTKVSLENDYSVAESVNYSENKSDRNIISITAMAELVNVRRVSTTILLREIIDDNSFLVPDFSTGVQFRINESKDYYLKANYSRNSRLPSMNDLFWSPGGNPSLANESANMFELIYQMDQELSSPLKFKFDISVYHNSIKNMIQWRPGEYAYWIADNVKNVSSKGLESSASFNYNLNNITSILNLSYTYTKSATTDSDILNDQSIGKQLIYVPENQANASLRFGYHNFYSYWISNLTGRRYTTSDNSSYLKGFLLNSISSGYVIQKNNNLYSIYLTVDNLFNTSYETIEYYPQPGRSYSLKLLIQLIK